MLSTLESPNRSSGNNFDLPKNVLDSFIDGILVLNCHGQWLHANPNADVICQQLNQGTRSKNSVPQPIWSICKTLIESRRLHKDRLVSSESEIVLNRLTKYRIRVQWLEPNDPTCAYLVVMLEDYYQSIRDQAIAEVRQFKLTAREAEVWLLHRSNFTYREISAELYISLNTVKRHMKSILAKRRLVVC